MNEPCQQSRPWDERRDHHVLVERVRAVAYRAQAVERGNPERGAEFPSDPPPVLPSSIVRPRSAAGGLRQFR